MGLPEAKYEVCNSYRDAPTQQRRLPQDLLPWLLGLQQQTRWWVMLRGQVLW